YKVLERFGRFTYIEATLKTGRTHQIRVHMAHINHPLLGDELYGPKKSPVRTEGQVLHAKTLGFQHPSSGKYVEFDSPLPEGFSQVLNKLR
ncbi:MAG: pseudouridine synthase, partial [Anaerovoracaceae bacterium]